MIKRIKIKILLSLPLFILFQFCDNPVTKQEKANQDTLVYLNHSPKARYVGMNTCKLCHQNIYNTFIKTGMGQSFDTASKTKSSAGFKHPKIYDKLGNWHYEAFWNDNQLYIKEYRLENRDTSHSRIEQVNFIIGSGQHTNSHIQLVNGYASQMPMTFYTQKKKWDLPPGFENGMNTRFSRKIGLECMSCHNAYPDFVLGSENKYKRLPNGIDCERCHGPGSEHVAQRQTGEKVDTSKYIDYSIVNPAKLPVEAQFDICQRCHLQGNAVLKNGKSFFDFKPGQKLSDFISVFLPKYKNAEDEFIMASHADRLKQSPCFIKSFEKVKGKNILKPYKEALTCVTCHNPHLSVRETNENVFNNACLNCHGVNKLNSKQMADLRKANCGLSLAKKKGCVNCHMPVSGSTDIPHVSVHDHYIRKPVSRLEKDRIKEFVGLFSVNERNPDKLTRAKAYLNQYDKFEQNKIYLDSAELILSTMKDSDAKMRLLFQLYFTQGNYDKILALVTKTGEENCSKKVWVHPSYDNADAWVCYHIAEAYSANGYLEKAVNWFEKAVDLAPFQLDFRNKLGSTYAALNKLKEATSQFNFILKENPKFIAAYSNLGYIKMLQSKPDEALQLYLSAKKLDPDNEALLLNLAAYYLAKQDQVSAKKELEKILSRNPNNVKAKAALQKINGNG